MSAGIWLYIILLIITLLGLLLNVYILVIVLLSKELATGNRLLLIHLSIVNLLLCLLFLLLVVPHMFHLTSTSRPHTRPPNPAGLCDLQGFLFSLLHSVAIWNICALNCDRYYAIASPLHYSVLINQKKVALCLITTWTLCCLVCLPPFFRIAPYSYDPDIGSCVPDFKSGRLSSLWYAGLFIATTFLLPAAVIVICNIKVLMIARYHRHRIASAIFEVTLSAQVTITHQKNPFYNSLVSSKFLPRKSAYNTVFELLASFIVIYLPYYSMIVVYYLVNLRSESLRNDFSNRILQPVFEHGRFSNELQNGGGGGGVISVMSLLSFALITSSTLVNSLLYGIKSKVLRKSFQNYWRKQKSKCEIYNEIQARTPSTCGSRRPSLTPLGILTKPAPLIRRSSEIGMETSQNNSTSHNNNSSSKSSSNSNKKTVKSSLSDRQMSTSTSKLSLSTQEKLTTTLGLSGGNGGNTRMCNSVSNINKTFFHIRSHPTNCYNQTEVSTTSFVTSPRILITKTLSQDADNGGGVTDEEFASLEPNQSLESATTYDSVRQSDSEKGFSKNFDADKAFDSLDSGKNCETFDSIESSKSIDAEKAFGSIKSFELEKAFGSYFESSSGKVQGGKVLSFLSLNSDSDEEERTISKTVSE